MYKVYLKQAVEMLKQNRFFSAIYIIGTALAITMVMIIAILYHLRTGNISPETKRDRMMTIKYGEIDHKTERTGGSSRLSYQTIRECFYPLQTPELVSGIVPLRGQKDFIQIPGTSEIYNGLVMGTDANFWKIFNFQFIAGKPYTEEEFSSAIKKAVLNESLAKRLFQTTDVIGRVFILNFEEYTVTGIVKDVPAIANYCYSEVWIPYTQYPEAMKGSDWSEGILGIMKVYILAKSRSDFDAIRKETNELVHKYNLSSINYTIKLNGQPDSIHQALLREERRGDTDFVKKYMIYSLVIFLFLLVPSINLTGMTSLRMKKRMEELGIRKTFGARNQTLLLQILYENLFLTFLGGLLGLIISWNLVVLLKDWLLTQYSWNGTPLSATMDLSPGMLINLSIFGYTILFCIIINILSALLPAWNALKKPVVESLYNK